MEKIILTDEVLEHIKAWENKHFKKCKKSKEIGRRYTTLEITFTEVGTLAYIKCNQCGQREFLDEVFIFKCDKKDAKELYRAEHPVVKQCTPKDVKRMFKNFDIEHLKENRGKKHGK